MARSRSRNICLTASAIFSSVLLASSASAVTSGSLVVTTTGCNSGGSATSYPAVVGGQANANGNLYLNGVTISGIKIVNNGSTIEPVLLVGQFYSDGSAYIQDTGGLFVSNDLSFTQTTWQGNFNTSGTSWVVNAQFTLNGCTVRIQGTSANIGF